jgi:hypothetical protein
MGDAVGAGELTALGEVYVEDSGGRGELDQAFAKSVLEEVSTRAETRYPR